MTDLAAIKARHVEKKSWPLTKHQTNLEPDGYKHWCKSDGQRWPCDAAQLLALLADTPSVEPGASRLADLAESVLADLASRPAITTWATPDVKVGDWFRVVVVTADEDKVIASLVSVDRPSVEPHVCANHDESLDEAYRKGWHDGQEQAAHERFGEVR